MCCFRYFVFFIIFFVVQIKFSEAQVIIEDRTFRGGIVAGFNGAQVEGDNLRGYHKFGFAGGFVSFVRLSSMFSLNINIEFSQKGTKSTLENTPPHLSYDLRLNYIDLPVIVHYHDFERVILGLGLSLNTLVNWKEYINDFPAHEAGSTPYSRIDLMGKASVGYFFNEHFGADFRFSHTLIPIRPKPTVPTDFWRTFQFNNVLSLRLIYLI